MSAASLHIRSNHIEYRRDMLTGWYVNGERGLEQGFTLETPPQRAGSGSLVLELAFKGDLTPRLIEDGGGIEFTSSEGKRVLQYGQLTVEDTSGRGAPGQLEPRPHEIRISFDANGAHYPITADLLAASPAWTAESDQAGARFGVSDGTAGDVNGDGYSDVVVGANLYNNGQEQEGRAYVYYGNGVDGLPMLPRQMRRDGWASIAHLGMSDHRTAFRLGLIGRMPLGREDVKLQWEVAPLIAFSDRSIIRGSSPAWIDTGTGGVEISQVVEGLTPGMPYHWRVRLLYRPGNALGQPASRWIHIPWAGWKVTYVRTSTKREIYLPLILRRH